MFRIFYILAAFVCLFSSSFALASETNLSSTPGFMVSSPTNVSRELRFQGDVGYIQESDFSNGLGSVEVGRLSLSADYWIFNLSYGYSHFSWREKGAVPFSSSNGRDPWEDLHDVTLQGRILNNSLGHNWRYWLNSQVSTSFESSFPGAVGAGLDGGVAYDFWDGWMVGVTARTVALSALRDDLFGESDFGFALAVSQKALRTAMRSLGITKKEGSDAIGFSFAFISSERTYRLAPSSPVANNGYLSIVYSKVGAYLDYSPDKAWTVSVGPEYYYDREYRLYDSAGKSGSSYRLDNGWGGYVRVLYRF